MMDITTDESSIDHEESLNLVLQLPHRRSTTVSLETTPFIHDQSLLISIDISGCQTFDSF